MPPRHLTQPQQSASLEGPLELDDVDAINLERINQRNRQIAHKREIIRAGIRDICEDCQNPIPKGRLKEVPDATRCVNCQGKFENKERQNEKHSENEVSDWTNVEDEDYADIPNNDALLNDGVVRVDF